MGGTSTESSHETTDHSFCSEVHSVGMSLCGPFLILSLSFLVTMGLLLVVEHLLHLIERSAHNTPYESVVNKVYKEMTCVGCLTFATMVINMSTTGTADEIPHEWHATIEHADFVVFVMTVIYVFEVSIHMAFLSVSQATKWKVTSEMSIDQLLVDFHEDEHDGLKRWLPYSPIRDQVEYKIFFSMFCHKFNIRKSEFNFASYLIESFKRYVVGLIEDSFFPRLLFGVFVGINIIRLEFIHVKTPHHCDEYCQAENKVWFFAVCGWALCAAAIVLGIVSRLYQLRLLACGGVNKVDDYRIYLLDEENRELAKLRAEKQGLQRRSSVTLGKADLKDTIESIKKQEHEEEMEKPPSARWSIRRKRLAHSLYITWRRCKRFFISDRDESDEEDEDFDPDASDRALDVIKEHDKEDPSEDHSSASQRRNSGSRQRLDSHDSTGNSPVRRSRTKSRLHKPILSALNQASSARQNFKRKSRQKMSFNTLMNLQGALKLNHKDREGRMSIVDNRSLNQGLVELSGIFFFHRPFLFYFSIQSVLFLYSVYCAFWVTNFVLLPGQTHRPVMWHCLIVLPIVFLTPIMSNVIKRTVFVKALSKLRQDVIGKVIEDDESAEKSCGYLREKLVERLKMAGPEHDNPAGHKLLMSNLVKECDEQNKGFISREGFRLMLRKLNLHFTDKKFYEVMGVIDKDRNGEMTAEELYGFIYPQEAKEEAVQRRIAAVAQISSRSTIRQQSSKSHLADAMRQRVGSIFAIPRNLQRSMKSDSSINTGSPAAEETTKETSQMLRSKLGALPPVRVVKNGGDFFGGGGSKKSGTPEKYRAAPTAEDSEEKYGLEMVSREAGKAAEDGVDESARKRSKPILSTSGIRMGSFFNRFSSRKTTVEKGVNGGKGQAAEASSPVESPTGTDVLGGSQKEVPAPFRGLQPSRVAPAPPLGTGSILVSRSQENSEKKIADDDEHYHSDDSLQRSRENSFSVTMASQRQPVWSRGEEDISISATHGRAGVDRIFRARAESFDDDVMVSRSRVHTLSNEAANSSSIGEPEVAAGPGEDTNSRCIVSSLDEVLASARRAGGNGGWGNEEPSNVRDFDEESLV